jgi:hypothetical protein
VELNRNVVTRLKLLDKIESYSASRIDSQELNNWAEEINFFEEKYPYEDEAVEEIIHELSMSPNYIKENINDLVVNRFIAILKDITNVNKAITAVSLCYNSNIEGFAEILAKHRTGYLTSDNLEMYLSKHFNSSIDTFPFKELIINSSSESNKNKKSIKQIIFGEVKT